MSWHELARPQVHGYDIQCVAFISSLHFASGADEKVVRVFQAPQNFVDNFKRISGMDFHCQSDSLPLGATTPALGLSNKAIYNTTSTHDDDGGDSSQSAQSVKNSFTSEVPVFAPVDLFEPPIEEYLLQNTLWPETQKLYGHGYEIYCVAANGRLLASACKASKVEHAVIRVWSVGSWQQIGSLSAHSLTVTQLSFSPDETMLLAVSRDRTWSLWNMTKEPFSLIAVMDKSTKAHSRIIWSCSWTHDSQSFATGSRDKKVCFWSKSSDSNDVWGLAGRPLECPQPVTAVDFSPKLTSCDKYLLAIGLENGEITFSLFSHPDEKWSPLIKIHPFLCHTSIVHRIRWQPNSTHSNRSAATGLLLASCSHDNSVRILRFNTQSITT
jgi:elongator complex protein 2